MGSTRLAGSGQLHAARDVILDPVRVPPLFRVNLDAFQLHAEMNVVASCHAGHSTFSHYLSAFDRITLMDVDLAQMAIDGLQTEAVVDHDAVAVNSQRSRIDHASIIRRLHP